MPFTSTLTPALFDGPLVRPGHGINLNKDIMAMATGSSSGKSLTISFHLAKKLRLGKPVGTNYPIYPGHFSRNSEGQVNRW